jgi:hypothetical protein
MKIERMDAGIIKLEITASELGILNNALNEICNGIDVPEFETRIGCSLEEAAELLKTINTVLRLQP